ncbi:MAG TPA: choice-of-anchor D domain-containing protein [Candidatus Limnocylindrales bacterium]
MVEEPRTARHPQPSRTRSAVAAGLVLGGLLGTVASGPAIALSGTSGPGLDRASGASELAPAVLTAELPGDGPSGGSQLRQAVSADGRWVAFASEADDLVSGDTNETSDMFLRDRAGGKTVRIPWVTGKQLTPNLEASEPTITADGGIVAFTVAPKAPIVGLGPATGVIGTGIAAPSEGSPARAAATASSPFPVVVRYDRATDKTTLASTAPNGSASPGRQPSISGDGGSLAYTAGSSSSQVVLAAGSSVVAVGEGSSSHPSISSDGRFIALQAGSGDGTGRTDVYRYDRSSGLLVLLSKGPGGEAGNGSSFSPSISADGSVVAFASTATNLTTTPDLDGTSQVYAWDLATAGIRLVSTNRVGAPGRGQSTAPAVSGSGRFVAFDSVAPDLDTTGLAATSSGEVPQSSAEATVPTRDVFVHDLVNGHTIRASLNSEGSESGGDSGSPSISGDGLIVAFDSTGPALVAGAANGFRQVFVREWSPVPSVVPDPLDFGSVVLGDRSDEQVVTVSDLGWAPFGVSSATITGANAGDFQVGTAECPGTTLFFRDVCRVGITFTPGAVGPRTGTLELGGNERGGSLTVRLVGTGIATATPPPVGPTPPVVTAPPGVTPPPVGPTPTGGVLGNTGTNPMLVLDPPLGPPGFVTTAIGTGFPNGALVRLAWDRGITASGPPVHVGPDGTFRVGVLVLPKSEQGQRSLVASSGGGAGFPDVSAPFLVVIGTAQPPASGAVVFVAPSVEPIVDRR